MYYERVLSSAEALYVSRAQQKIAELTVIMAEESSRNDVDDFNAELVTELEYSINALKSTDLAWTDDEIQMVMDYYTLQGELVVFAFRSIVFNPINSVIDGYIWATVPQLREVETNSINYDAYLLSLIQQEIIDRGDGDDFLLNLINNFEGGALTAELTASTTIGGIREGRVFPIGTSLEDIWIALLTQPATITNFTFDSYSETIEVGVNMAITEFTWDVEGTPENLTISDSKGLMVDVPVTGVSHSISLGYDWSVPETLTWTISGDNIDDVTITIERVYGSYYGKEATADDSAVNVTEAKILAGSKHLAVTSTSITKTTDTSAGEQGFIAVPKAQTVTSYTKWTVDNTNFSDILVGEFISPPVDVLVNGVTYEVYRWGYRSPLTKEITLHR